MTRADEPAGSFDNRLEQVLEVEPVEQRKSRLVQSCELGLLERDGGV